MFERFTKAARYVVEDAVRIADGSRTDEVRPEHLFAALLQDEECLAVRVLDGMGASAGKLRACLDSVAGKYVDGLGEEDAEALKAFGIDLDEVVRRIDSNLGGLAPRRRRPRFSRASKKALQLALREAIALHHNYIGTEHLLLGLVRGGDRVVVDTLASCDVRPDALRTAVADAVRQAG
jgi:ATP-dependent Clp protease ATP-binding subunit ClpA